MNRDTGIRNLIPGVRFDSEVKEDLRSQIEMRKRLEGMATPEPVQPDLRFAPAVDLKPTEIVHMIYPQLLLILSEVMIFSNFRRAMTHP